jgi:hypothetical protein
MSMGKMVLSHAASKKDFSSRFLASIIGEWYTTLSEFEYLELTNMNGISAKV